MIEAKRSTLTNNNSNSISNLNKYHSNNNNKKWGGVTFFVFHLYYLNQIIKEN